MKKIVLSLFIVSVLSFGSLSASTNYPFSAGISISGKIGVNAAEVPNGVQNALSVLKGVDIALLGYLPMSENSKTGLFVELGYTNTPFGLKYYGTNETGHINQKLITISPLFLMSGFVVGLDFGFAASTAVDDNVVANLLPMENSLNVNVRVGGMIPLHTSKIGVLNFTANATYSLTGSDYWQGAYTYNPTTLSIGLNYLFNLENF